MMFLCLGLLADDIDDKVKQLRQLEQELESTQQKVKQTETKKKQTQSELSKTATMKRQTDEQLRKLSLSEAIVKDSVSAVNRRLENVNNHLSQLDRQLNHNLNIMLRKDRIHLPSAKTKKDQHLYIDLAKNLKRNLDILSGFKVILNHDYEAKRNEYSRVNRNLKKEKTKSISYDKKIKNLQVTDKLLTQEQRDLQTRIQKLRTDAAALETLISQLSAAAGKEPVSHLFSTRKIPWPLKGKVIRSYGEETRSYGTSIVNNGIDIAVPEGTPVKCVDDGEVVFSDRYGGQGKLVIIDHKNGYFSVYAYNSDLLVNRGDKVKKGQVIAKSGMTGSASQASLHFELRRDGKAVNPLNYLE